VEKQLSPIRLLLKIWPLLWCLKNQEGRFWSKNPFSTYFYLKIHKIFHEPPTKHPKVTKKQSTESKKSKQKPIYFLGMFIGKTTIIELSSSNGLR